jgi:hypothetical protein
MDFAGLWRGAPPASEDDMFRNRFLASLAFFGLLILGTAGGSSSASAQQGCGPWNNWCMPQCGDWNNWCAQECGPWNNWCLAQRVEQLVLGRMRAVERLLLG